MPEHTLRVVARDHRLADPNHVTHPVSLTSHAFELVAPRVLELRDEELDLTTIGDDELVAMTKYSAVSLGTELAAFQGLEPLRPTAAPYPRRLGYMNVAEVIRAGTRAADSFPPGSLVYTQAAHRSAFRIGADAVLARLADGESGREAAPAYLYRLAWNALRRGDARTDATVAVLGLGAIGRATLDLARLLGSDCTAVSDSPDAPEVAARLGVRHMTREAARELVTNPSAASAERPAGLTVLTTNGWDDWSLGLALTRFNGVVSVVGFPGRGQPPPAGNPLTSEHLYDRQLTIVAAGFGPDRPHETQEPRERLKSDMQAILSCIATGDLQPSILIDRWVDASALAHELRSEAEQRVAGGTVGLDWTRQR